MRWRQVFWAVTFLAVVLTIGLRIVYTHLGNGDARFRALLRVNDIRQRLEPFQSSPTYRKITEVTKVDLIRRERERADRLELSLLRSGDLVHLWFFAPNLETQNNLVRSKCEALMGDSTDQVAAWWLLPEDDMVCVHCRPGFAVSAQSAFCCITNRVPWNTLRRIGGSRDDVDCFLPGGSLVDLDQCQNWLNESVAAGWMVGVMAKSERPGHCVIVVTRGKRQQEVQQVAAPNERRQH